MRPGPCCRKNCIGEGIDNEDHVSFITGCVEEYIDMNRAAKSNYMMEKIRSCIMKPEVNDKKARYSWTVGVAPNKVIHNVCPQAFQRFYSISHTSVEKLCHEIKKGSISSIRPFSDSATFPSNSKHNIMIIDSMCEDFGIKLNPNAKQVLS